MRKQFFIVLVLIFITQISNIQSLRISEYEKLIENYEKFVSKNSTADLEKALNILDQIQNESKKDKGHVTQAFLSTHKFSNEDLKQKKELINKKIEELKKRSSVVKKDEPKKEEPRKEPKKEEKKIEPSAIPPAPLAPSDFPKKEIKKKEKEKKEEKKEPEKKIESKTLVPIHDLVILLDNEEDASKVLESSDTLDAIFQMFSFALCQENFPIIVTSQIFRNYLILHTNVDYEKSELYKFIVDINLNKKNWKIFKTKEEDFYLFIPERYLKKQENDFILKKQFQNLKNYPNYLPIEILSGFKINPKAQVLFEVSDLFYHLLEIKDKSLINQVKKTPEIKILNLLRMIINEKDNIFGLWNIFISGHGFYSHTLTENLKTLTFKELEKIDIKNVQINGVSVNEFKKIINFLSNQINTNFLYQFCCFSGDNNLILTYLIPLINNGKIISEAKKPNFTIVNASLLNSSIFLFFEFDKCVYKKNNLKIQNFNLFFDLLRKYSKTEVTIPIRFKDNELKEILNAITPKSAIPKDPYGIFLLPQIMFPNTNVFTAFPLTDKVFVINEVINQKHQIEKKPFIINDKEALLIYPDKINVDLKITVDEKKIATPIISLLPGISLTTIDNLETNASFFKLINEMFGNITVTWYTKFFYIKKLNLINDKYGINSFKINEKIFLKNVLIRSEEKYTSILFTDENNKIYSNSKEYLSSDTDLHNNFKTYLPDSFVNILINYYPYMDKVIEYYNLTKFLTSEEKEIFDKEIKKFEKEEKD